MSRLLRWTLIGLGVVAVAIVVVIVATVVGTGGKALTGGVPRGDVEFGAGDLPGFPVYPGSSQTVGRADIQVPDDLKRLVGTTSGPWRLYSTPDTAEEVLAWYDTAMAAADIGKGGDRDSGVVLYTRADKRHFVHILAGDGHTRFILATATE